MSGLGNMRTVGRKVLCPERLQGRHLLSEAAPLGLSRCLQGVLDFETVFHPGPNRSQDLSLEA